MAAHRREASALTSRNRGAELQEHAGQRQAKQEDGCQHLFVVQLQGVIDDFHSADECTDKEHVECQVGERKAANVDIRRAARAAPTSHPPNTRPTTSRSMLLVNALSRFLTWGVRSLVSTYRVNRPFSYWSSHFVVASTDRGTR